MIQTDGIQTIANAPHNMVAETETQRVRGQIGKAGLRKAFDYVPLWDTRAEYEDHERTALADLETPEQGHSEARHREALIEYADERTAAVHEGRPHGDSIPVEGQALGWQASEPDYWSASEDGGYT